MGSCILVSPTPGSPYSGTWTDGFDYHAIHFFINPAHTEAHAESNWQLGIVTDNAMWLPQATPNYPTINYVARHLVTLSASWSGCLQITG